MLKLILFTKQCSQLAYCLLSYTLLWLLSVRDVGGCEVVNLNVIALTHHAVVSMKSVLR